jgi:aryl-alcohol dehydrogenase-like predicted oxidoreductase
MFSDTHSGVILGTAQLTESYGVLRQSVASTGEGPVQFLETAVKLGIRSFDTAPRYGDSELLLGQIESSIAIHTKLELGVSPCESIKRSLERLARPTVEIAYLHDPDAAIRDGGQAVDDATCLIGDSVEQLGVSVYDIDQMIAGFDHPSVSVIQIPVNPLSRRLADEAFKRRSTASKVIGRSVFAQGVLLIEPALLPQQVSYLAKPIAEFHALCREIQRPIDQVLLMWAQGFAGLDGVVIGTASETQLRRLVECLSATPLDHDERTLIDDWSTRVSVECDPRVWK